MTDAQLLARYVTENSHDAFTALVTQHAGWVHSLAHRTVRDSHLAHDVTQAVFLLLAERAGTIRDGTRLAAWLHRATTFASMHAIREAARRRQRERVAAAMRPEANDQSNPAKPDPSLELYSTLDQAVARLNTADREVIARRFYQGESLDALGAALGISADAARKRVARSVDRLRQRLARLSPSIELQVLLGPLAAFPHATASHSAQMLAASALHPATLPARITSLTKGAMTMMARAKLRSVCSIVLVVLLIGSGVLIACADGGSKATPPTASHVDTPSTPYPARVIAGEELLIAVSPDGKQLVGYAIKSGAVARVEGEDFKLDPIIIGKYVGVYRGQNGTYYGFSSITGTWGKVDVPPEAAASPLVGENVIVAGAKGTYIAFSPTTGTWGKLTLPRDADVEPKVFRDMATVEVNGHYYAFSAGSAKWTTVY